MFGLEQLPRGFDYSGRPGLFWLHIVSNLLIALAFFLLSMLPVRIVRGRRDLPFYRMFLCFAAFFMACGVLRAMEVMTLWRPMVWVSGSVMVATAVTASLAVLALLRSTPRLLGIPGQAALDEANQRLTSVLESTRMGIYAVDRAWTIRYINDQANRMPGHLGQVLGKYLWTAFPHLAPATAAKMREVMRTREPMTFESYDEPLDLWTNVKVHPWDDGGITVYFSDISEWKMLERELEEERARRIQRIEVLARLSSGLAHEIRNPLAIIHARASDLAEMAAEGDVGRTQIAKACASIVGTSDRALRILRGVAAMARLGTNDPMREAEVSAMVEQAVELVHGRYLTHGIRLDTVVPAGLPRVPCREVQIEQILVNLLNNAFDAVDRDARSALWVRVEVSVQPGAEPTDKMERLQIDVVDGGPGVPPEVRERLMESFFTTKAEGAGIGIGLSVSLAIAEDHGGHLELRNSDGHTCFRLTLPLRSAHPEGAAA